jgi:hypothetical protein
MSLGFSVNIAGPLRPAPRVPFQAYQDESFQQLGNHDLGSL